jgi:ubiquitin-protein ligase E3 A
VKENKLNLKLMVSFKNEQAVDIVGVSREFYYLHMNNLFPPNYGMLTLFSKSMYWFSPISLESSLLYSTLSTVVGLAISNNIHLPIRFPLLMYKRLKNLPLHLQDLNEIDLTAFKSLSQLLEMKGKNLNVSNTELTFSIIIDNFSASKDIEFIPGGTQTILNDENLDQYMSCYIKYFLVDSIENQFYSFLKGF